MLKNPIIFLKAMCAHSLSDKYSQQLSFLNGISFIVSAGKDIVHCIFITVGNYVGAIIVPSNIYKNCTNYDVEWMRVKDGLSKFIEVNIFSLLYCHLPPTSHSLGDQKQTLYVNQQIFCLKKWTSCVEINIKFAQQPVVVMADIFTCFIYPHARQIYNCDTSQLFR